MSIRPQPLVNETVTVGNLLSLALAAEDFEMLHSALRSMELKRGMPLTDINKPIEFVHFNKSGIVSIMTRADDWPTDQKDSAGRENRLRQRDGNARCCSL